MRARNKETERRIEQERRNQEESKERCEELEVILHK